MKYDNDFNKLSINASIGNYDNLSFDELKLELLKKDIELARLKNCSVVYIMEKGEKL